MFGDTRVVAEDTSANAAETPAAETAPAEEVALVKMQRDYDKKIEEVHPDGVSDYLQSGCWKVIN